MGLRKQPPKVRGGGWGKPNTWLAGPHQCKARGVLPVGTRGGGGEGGSPHIRQVGEKHYYRKSKAGKGSGWRVSLKE